MAVNGRNRLASAQAWLAVLTLPALTGCRYGTAENAAAMVRLAFIPVAEPEVRIWRRPGLHPAGQLRGSVASPAPALQALQIR